MRTRKTEKLIGESHAAIASARFARACSCFHDFRRTGMSFRTVDRLKIEQLWMNVYHGGTQPSPHDQHVFIDNVVIARKYIGTLK